MPELLPTITVTAGTGGYNYEGLPGSTTSRGDPHRSGLTAAERAANQARRQAERAAREAALTPVVPTVAPLPEPEEPTLGELDPEGLYHIEGPAGEDVSLRGGNFDYPIPLRESPQPTPERPPSVPSKAFVGPSPVPLPEVVVTTKRPPTPTAPRAVPVAPIFGGLNPLLLGLGFLLKQTSANIGENARVRELIRADLTQRLLSVVPSVYRLAEPLPEVTVRSSRISDRPTTRTSNLVPRGSLGVPSLRSFTAPFLPKPTSVLKPAPQKRAKPLVEPSYNFKVGPSIDVTQTTIVTAPRPRTTPRPSSPRPFFPSVPVVPIVGGPIGLTPVSPGIRPIGAPSIGTPPGGAPPGSVVCSCRHRGPPKKKKRKPKSQRPPQEMEMEYEDPKLGKVKVTGQVKKLCYLSPTLIKVPSIGRYGQPTVRRVRKRICL